MVDFNPRGAAEDPRVEALRMAADAHGLANGTNEALLAAHQNCAYETTGALPVITLTEEQAKNERVSRKVNFKSGTSFFIYTLKRQNRFIYPTWFN